MAKKEKPVLNYLELTPVYIVDFIDEGGMVTVLEPKFKKEWLKKLLKPVMKHENLKVRLDEIGSATWRLINGERKVQDIVNELVRIFGEKIDPADLRTTKFLTGLMHHDYITFKELTKERKY
ncbi:MAG: PqqD family protein [Ignavibacteriales bacterium]|nr:hypothetical protein [Ignavibacteriaceae bacterium]QOJ28990.1 MAG: PqqD family protein [Ignavibacteriales bacterium]